ncbi:hypothetical protein ElyMa_000713100 [Elysia marginata]|uniref:Uncharacterized protein n=1 Tax=Elysia marginata TaxID=1093978 RepID=A0AAV4GP80_9GAST|nr:hypothetical protein ElyMa_000713100 [Elysia marginata]
MPKGLAKNHPLGDSSGEKEGEVGKERKLIERKRQRIDWNEFAEAQEFVRDNRDGSERLVQVSSIQRRPAPSPHEPGGLRDS